MFLYKGNKRVATALLQSEGPEGWYITWLVGDKREGPFETMHEATAWWKANEA